MRMKKAKFQTKFQLKIFTYFSVLITLIIGISAVSLYKYMSDDMMKQAQKNMMQTAENASQQIDSLLQTMDSVAIQTVCNSYIQSTFENLSSLDSSENNYFEQGSSQNLKSETCSMLFSINSPLLLVKRISIFNMHGDYVNSGILGEQLSSGNHFVHSEQADSLFSFFSQSRQFRMISTPHQDYWNEKNKDAIISIYRPIRESYSNKVCALAEVQQPYSLFTDVFSNLPNMNAYVFNNDRELIYPAYNTEDQEDTLRFLEEEILDKTTSFFEVMDPVSDEPELIACHQSSDFGWQIVLVQSKNVILSNLYIMATVFFLIAIVLIGILFIIVLLLSNHLAKPLLQLKEAIQTTNLTHMDVQLDTQSKDDEFNQLNTAFQEMLLRLKNAITGEINAQICALQSQMSPHFLYNTIAVISATAQENDNQLIVDMCQTLSDMLRYSSSFSKEQVTLRDEIEYSQSYMQLMKMRYEDCLYYDFRIAPDCLSIQTPKFILQPLLENCFQHGLTHVEFPWYVSVEINASETEWCITVSDNGSGFPDGMISAITEKAETMYLDLQNELPKSHIGHLGLSSIYVRLKAIYKDNLIFQLENKAPHGAQIRIGGKMYVEHHDR